MARKKPAPQEQQVAAVFVDVDKLLPWVKNPRKNDHAVDTLARSIERFGFGAPLLARKANGEVIAGHTRLKAAIKLGLKQVPVRYLDLSEKDAHALAVADNKIGELSDWDDDLLKELLEEQGEELAKVAGFTSMDLDALNLLGEVPDFQPAGEEQQGKLDQSVKLCPHCGKSLAQD